MNSLAQFVNLAEDGLLILFVNFFRHPEIQFFIEPSMVPRKTLDGNQMEKSDEKSLVNKF